MYNRHLSCFAFVIIATSVISIIPPPPPPPRKSSVLINPPSVVAAKICKSICRYDDGKIKGIRDVDYNNDGIYPAGNANEMVMLMMMFIRMMIMKRIMKKMRMTTKSTRGEWHYI